MDQYLCAKGTNRNYLTYISCESMGVEVVCDLPEQFSIGVQSDWESRLPYSLADAFSRVPIFGGLLENAQAIAGTNVQFQDLSYQMWMGTTPLEIPLTLLFDAETSALEQVYKPIQALVGMALPGNQGAGVTTILTAPGPLAGGTANDGSVNIRIGQMFYFEHCAVVSANQTLDSRFAADGYPIAGECEIVLRTGMVYGKSDWLKAAGFGG